MALPKLVPAAEQVQVQDTSFSTDALGRHICSTWQEATGNGGPPVRRSGRWRRHVRRLLARPSCSAQRPGKRVLVLDAGRFLVAEHVQNLGRVGLDVPAPIWPTNDPGVARELVWGLPWRGNVEFPGLAYCSGGKSLYWGGWCPRLTAGDLAAVADRHGPVPDRQLHQRSRARPASSRPPTSSPAICTLALWTEFVTAAASTANIDTGLGDHGVQPPPLAVQGSAPVSGLFSFDKYSSLPLLIDAIRQDVQRLRGSTTPTGGSSWCPWPTSSSCTQPAARSTPSRSMSPDNASCWPSRPAVP